MNKILAIVHQETSNPGLVGQLLRAKGYQLDLCCPALGDPLPSHLDPYCAVIIFGGPMSANDDHDLPFVRAELDWIPTVLTADKPFLGICLGAQMLARVLGATVTSHPEDLREIGYFPIQPTNNHPAIFGQPMQVYHWHREGFELPSGTTLLAQGETFRNQAFQYGKTAYGLQFHPEMTQDLIHLWTTNGADQLTLPGAQSREEQFRNHALHGSQMREWLDRFLDHWLAIATPHPIS